MSRADTTSRLIVTCRPDVSYPTASAVTFSIKGISEEEALQLFQLRNPGRDIPEDDIKEAWRVTSGHAFWLDLMAVQIDRVPGTTLKNQLSGLSRGEDNAPDVLSSIWHRLAQREQTLLRLMAEAIRPETEETIKRFASSQLGYAAFGRSFRSLKALNLIVTKPMPDAADLFDLHPLVRQFVKKRYQPAQRQSFIKVVLSQYDVIIGTISTLLGIHMPFSMLERWSQKAELQVSAGYIEEAFDTLSDAEDALIGGGHSQEYVRVARLILAAVDWETAAVKFNRFDRTVGLLAVTLEQLGDSASADGLLSSLEATIPQKTARYINFCDVKGYTLWLRKDFDAAIEWAAAGVRLKNESKVDTAYDSEHTLALAQRDSGDYQAAMSLFLKGREFEDLFDPEASKDIAGTVFGNVGRCLQLMGRTDEALICYKKSIFILETDTTLHSKSNRAYARSWIAEVLASRRENTNAEAFYVDAMRVLGPSSPVRVRELVASVEALVGERPRIMSERDAQRIVSAWIRN